MLSVMAPTTEPNKLDRLSVAGTSSLDNCLPIMLHSRISFWPYPQELTRLERPARDNHGRLFDPFVNYKKSFITLAPVVNLLKLFSSSFMRAGQRS